MTCIRVENIIPIIIILKMKKLTLKLLIAFLPAIAGMAHAASDSSIIDIQVKHIEFVRLIGSAAGISKTIDLDDIRFGSSVNIGSLGLQSTIAGDCSVDFVSLNGYSLKYSQGNQRLTDYQLDYMGNTITSDITLVLPCNTVTTALDFQAIGKFKKKAKAGLYSDTITLTLTSP